MEGAGRQHLEGCKRPIPDLEKAGKGRREEARCDLFLDLLCRSRDTSDILVLVDAEEEDQPTEMTEELASPQARTNGSYTRPAGSKL